MMTVLHTHYFVDYTAGFVAACLIIRYGERLIYWVDVKVMGAKTKNRGSSLYWRNCSGCGWANIHAARYTDD